LAIPDDVYELKLLVKVLLDKIAALELTISKMESENAFLKAENAELKSRLNLDSHNSSKPPSTDGLRKKPAFPRERGGMQGGQENHQGKTLEMVKKPDQIIVCKPERCGCGRDLSQEPTTIISHRQEFDLPIPRLEVIEYQLAQIACPGCGQKHQGVYPKWINAPVQYGNNVKALTVLLNNDYKLPFKKIQDLFHDIYGYSINEGTIISANQSCYENLAQTETAIQNSIIASAAVNSDESGIRCNGKLHWLHVASTAMYTYLFVHKNRGKEAIESNKSILKRLFGWSVHDCWSSYFNLKHLKHAVCGAHLLRELQSLVENSSLWAKDFQSFLLKTYKTPIQDRIANRAGIEIEFDTIINQAQIEEPMPRKTGKKGKLKRTKGRNLLERLQKHKQAVLAFAFNAEVPFTNNQAERDIRPVKVKLKVSGCFRTLTGAEHYARIASFTSTTRKNQLNIFKELCNAFNGYTFLTITQPK
jgi:transposase